MYIGIDGCRKGWIMASIDDNKTLALEIIGELEELNKMPPAIILIDMPIGFPENKYRQCEIEARVLLGNDRRSSVFFTPHKKAVYANSHSEANSINKQFIGKGISIQAWSICKKIKQLNEFVEENKHLQIKESHPELCFYHLNSQKALSSKKNKPEGVADRKKIIHSHSKDYLGVIQQTLLATKRKNVKIDDILDATVMAIRASKGDLNYIPTSSPDLDCHTIVY